MLGDSGGGCTWTVSSEPVGSSSSRVNSEPEFDSRLAK